MIPSINVNEALGMVTSSGEDVQLRINGRVSSIDQVKSLLPETIKRVEWIDNPGLRYNGATSVLNFIVANPAIGGAVMTNAMPALNQAWGNYFADFKLNSGYSQFEVWGRFKLTNKIKSHREYKETFTYPDGTSISRNETSRGGIMDNSMGNFAASYSYIKPDTTVLMVDLSYFKKFSDRFLYKGLLSLSDRTDDILLHDMHGDKGGTPGLSVYLEQHLPDRQILVVDFNASFYHGRSYHDYIEQMDGGDLISDVHTLIKDRNQAYAVEANYIKNWNKSRLTAGASYTANRNRSVYENLGGQVFHQRQDKAYFLLNISIISARLHLRAAWERNILHLISVSRTRETVRGICALSLQPLIVLPIIRSSGLILLRGSLRHRLPRQMWRLSRLTVSSGV